MRTTAIFAIIALCWGGSYVALKIGLPYSRPFSYAMMSTLIGGLALAPVAWIKSRSFPRDLYTHGMAGLLGLFNSGFYIGLLNLAMSARGMSAGMASVMTYTQPLMVVILAIIFLGERPGRRGLLGIAIGFTGMVVAMSSSIGPGVAPVWSYLCLLGAALSWGMGTVIYKRVHMRIDMLWSVALQGIYAAIPLGFAAYLVEGNVVFLRPTLPSLLALAQMSLLSSGVAMALYIYLLKHHAAIKVSALLFVVPLTAVILGALVLGERLTPAQALGGAGVLAGIYLSSGPTQAPARRQGAESAVPAAIR